MSKNETNSQKEEKRLPVFGVGPIYVISCLILVITSIVLTVMGYLKQGEILRDNVVLGRAIFITLGVITILLGIFLWVYSVIIQDISEEIKQGKLVTTGVYAVVRNPIYSAFLFIFTGALLILRNWFVLILPFLFWIYLTLLMKYTEEVWLKEKFGDEYISYCKQVNRVIPWFRKKKKN